MSTRKFTHRASMTNRPTGGGPKKAGLAPFATNFMMGVKTNHNFDNQPQKTHINFTARRAYIAALLARASVTEVAAVLAALTPPVLPAHATEAQVTAAEAAVAAAAAAPSAE